jgi:hypothetical protein
MTRRAVLLDGSARLAALIHEEARRQAALDLRPPRTGRELRDEGMARAVEHADAIYPEWSDVALSLLRTWCASRIGQQKMLPVPPDKRAWGAVMLRAAKAGYIEKVGYGACQAPNVHRSICTMWRAR